MKNRSLILLLILTALGDLRAQFVNDGSQITIQSNALVHIQGDFIHQDGIINNTGVIEIGTNWINNGNTNPLVESDGLIDFVGSDQLITGITESIFYQLQFSGTGEKTLEQSVQVNDQLNLEDALLFLNEQRLIVNREESNSITRANGWVISETDTNYGWLQWNIGSNVESYTIPFGNINNYIPIIFEVENAGMGAGSISFTSYPTLANNSPLPDGITNLDVNGENDSLRMVDRFWLLEETDYTINPTANLQLSYTTEDILSPNTIDPNTLQVAQWDNSMTWDTLSSEVNANEVSTLALNNYGVFTLRSPDETTSIFSINQAPLSFNYYPNPVTKNSELTIELASETHTIITAILTDTKGRIISTIRNPLLRGSNFFNIPIPNVPTGSYFLRLETDGKIGTKKLTIY